MLKLQQALGSASGCTRDCLLLCPRGKDGNCPVLTYQDLADLAERYTNSVYGFMIGLVTSVHGGIVEESLLKECQQALNE